jgi:hypothetical protein
MPHPEVFAMEMHQFFPHLNAKNIHTSVDSDLTVMDGSIDVLVPLASRMFPVSSLDVVGIPVRLEVKAKTGNIDCGEFLSPPKDENVLKKKHISKLGWDTQRLGIDRLYFIERAEALGPSSFVSQALNDLRKCGSRPIALLNQSSSSNVTFEMSDKTGAIKVGGLAYCDRLTCPLCADRLGKRRAAAIIDGLHCRLDKAQKSTAVAITLTVPHSSEDSFETVYSRLNEKLESLIKFYRSLERKAKYYGLLADKLCGYVASFESTIGRNGHHAHWHLLLWLPSIELAEALQKFVRTKLCDLALGSIGVTKSAEIIQSSDMSRLIMYIQKSMFEATGVGKSVHKNGNVGLFDWSTDWHVKMYAEVHCGTKGKRLFRAGGDFRRIINEADERVLDDDQVEDSKQLVAAIITDEGFDTTTLPADCIYIECFYRQRLKLFCASGRLYDCIEVLRTSNRVDEARERIGKIFETFLLGV